MVVSPGNWNNFCAIVQLVCDNKVLSTEIQKLRHYLRGSLVSIFHERTV